jgi:hypothetical protein
MARVTRDGGLVAACVWDHAGKQSPLAPFWDAVRQLDPAVPDESRMAGGHQGHLTELITEAGLTDVAEEALAVLVEHDTFAAWWEPFTLGVGPAGAYLESIDRDRQAAVRVRCLAALGHGPFTIQARVWAARGYVG